MLQIGGVVFVPFAENLRRLQTATQSSNYRLAKFLGCSQTSIANWMKGERLPHDKARCVIAGAFGLSLGDIDGELPDGWEKIVEKKMKKPAPKTGNGQLPEGYYELNPENKALVDSVIARLLASQSEE